VIAGPDTKGQAVPRACSQRRLRTETVDRLLAAVLLVWALFDVPWWWRPPGHGGSAPLILGVIALAAAQSAPFLWRRQQPAAVLALAGAALAVKYAAGLNLWSAGAAVLAAAYGLGAYGSNAVRRAGRVLAACALLAVFVALQADHGSHGPAVACALLATALGMGEVTSAHRDTAAAAAWHAQDMERARLARDLHDVVAHQLSAIAVQAGAVRLAAAGDPQAAAAGIAAIERQARSGLTELNQLVRELRPTRGIGLGMPPQPGLGDVADLVERAGDSGLRADLRVDGEPRPLPAAIELAGYRVVQESLTNAIRYAAGATVTVHLVYRDDGIMVEVSDDGPGAPEDGDLGAAGGAVAINAGGAGLAGLKERARLLGGQLEAGRAAGRGFLVRAFLPSPA
jgi:signal transduction histidine kinase